MDLLSESTRLLYAQLQSQCPHGAAPSGRGLSFVNKQIKGAKHWHLQLTIGSSKTQHYLGPGTVEVRGLIERGKALWVSARPDLRSRDNLVAMLSAGGAHATGTIEAPLFELLEGAQVFHEPEPPCHPRASYVTWV